LPDSRFFCVLVANLKNENEALQLKVHVLESRLKELGDDKGMQSLRKRVFLHVAVKSLR